MTRNDQCQEFRELFPLYFNSSLEQAQVDEVRSHLAACTDCRSLFISEHRLFALAGSQSPLSAVDTHADSDLLDQYSRNAASIEMDRRAELEAHLEQCHICRDAAQKLALLPYDLEEIAPATDIPILSAFDEEAARTPERVRQTDVTRRIWRPLTALAAAAILVVVVTKMFNLDRHEPIATVEGIFPAITRAVAEPRVFYTEAEEFTFIGRVYIDPEEDHVYRLQVRDAASDSLLYEVARIATFDTIGFGRFELPMRFGRYRLVVYDIVASDTTDALRIVRLFEIQLIP